MYTKALLWQLGGHETVKKNYYRILESEDGQNYRYRPWDY